MKNIDVSEKVHSEFLTRFSFVREGAARACFWAPAEYLKVNGREGCSPGHGGIVVTESGSVIVYGGKSRMLGWEWVDAVHISQDDIEVRAELDVNVPRLELNVWRRDRNCHAHLRLPLHGKPTHLGDYHRLRGFPERIQIAKHRFSALPVDIKSERLEVQVGIRKEGRGLVAEGPGTVLLRCWSGNEIPDDLELPLASHLATCRTKSGSVFYVFVPAGRTTLVETAPTSSLDDFLSDVQPTLAGPILQLLPGSRPALFEIAGEFLGEAVPETRVVIIPLTEKRLEFLVPEPGGKSWTLDVPVNATYFDSQLILFSKEHGILLAIRAELPAATRFAEALGTNLAKYPWDAGFLALHHPRVKDGAENGVPVPIYFYKSDRRFEGWNKTLPFDVDSKSLTRCVVDGRPEYLLKRSNTEAPLKLLVPEVDDRRLRETVLVGQVEDDAAGNDIEHLYQVLNQLRVRNFLTRLFDDLLLLHQQIHAPPSITELLEDYSEIMEPGAGKNAQTSLPPPRRTEKQLREDMLKKVVLLATTLPELKRNLERLGTFYPYQVLTWDEQWLGRTFGQEVAQAILSHARPGMISELRGFVRSTQAAIWRSLAEIERILGRLEPVYSERMKEVRKKAFVRQLGASAITGALGAAVGNWYIPAASAVNALSSGIGAWDLGQQNNAVLLDNAEEMLRWLQTFSDSLVMQIGESNEFLVRFFKRLSLRDRKLVLEHVNKEHQPAALLTIRSVLKDQIRIETNSRFTELWEGAPQIRQDLVEAVEQLIHQGSRLTQG
jgi:hypothetical protein